MSTATKARKPALKRDAQTIRRLEVKLEEIIAALYYETHEPNVRSMARFAEGPSADFAVGYAKAGAEEALRLLREGY